MTSFLLVSGIFYGHDGMHGAHGLAQEGGLQALALAPEDTEKTSTHLSLPFFPASRLSHS